MTVAQRLSAKTMIAAKGQTITIAGKSGTSTLNPSTRAVTSTAYSATTTAVLLPLTKARKVDGDLIKQSDETLLISALDSAGAALAEPPVNSTVTLADGSKRTIIAIDQLSPAGLVIMFDAVVRRVQ